jgi:hypothetical protein
LLSEAFGNEAAQNFVVIEENQKPDHVLPTAFSALGLLAGLFSLIVFVKTRNVTGSSPVTSDWPPQQKATAAVPNRYPTPKPRGG